MPRPGRRTSVTAVAAVLGCVPLAACAGGSGGSGPGGPGRPDGSTFVGALAELPRLDGGPLTVTWSDLDAVREANGYADVPDLDDDDARSDYVGRMAGFGDGAVVPVSLAPLDRDRVPDESGQGFGWPSAEAVASVYAADEQIAWYAAGDDISPGDAPAGLALAADGREAVLATDEALADAWREGSDDALADDEDVSAVAAALDDAGSVSGVIVGLAPDARVDLVGVGWRDDDGDPAFTLVYAFDSDDDADGAREEVADGLADLTDSVDVDEVRADGPLVVVTGHQVERLLAPYDLLQNFQLPVVS